MIKTRVFTAVGQGPQLCACVDQLLKRGHRLAAVVSDCPIVTEWANKHSLLQLGAQADIAQLLTNEPVDYLLSIVNHAILSPQVLRLPRIAAINYHDSLLPDYAGFNATAWSIVEGKATHGITWHLISEEVDGGKILRQVEIPITDEDTAFTLGVKCGAAGLQSFESLLDDLEQERVEGAQQRPGGCFHRRSERLGVALFDWHQTSDVLHCLARGLRFVSEDNWMGTPKLRTPLGQCLSVLETEISPTGSLAGDSTQEPGTVLELSSERFVVATGDGALTITQLSTLTGTDVPLGELSGTWGVKPGVVLTGWDLDSSAGIERIDQRITKSERFWVRRLASIETPKLNELRTHAGNMQIQRLPLEQGAIPEQDPQARLEMATAALATYLSRCAETTDHMDLGFSRALQLEHGSEVFAEVCPLRLRPSMEQPFAELLGHVRQEFATQGKRETYACDVLQRYQDLRELPAAPSTLPIGVVLCDGEESRLPAGMGLALCISPSTGAAHWCFDSNAISQRAVDEIAARVNVIMATAAAQPECRLNDLPVVTEAERSVLLEDWQQTDQPHDRSKCLHELFEDQVARTPDGTALVFRDQEVTYRELNRQAERVALHLQGAGVGPDDLVALCIDRSIEMVAGLLGILKAGAAYVPLDPAYPKERLALMLEDSHSSILLTRQHLLGRLPQSSVRALLIEDLLSTTPESDRLQSRVAPPNLAYVIFTSGSSGRPKGVMVEHRNAVNFLAAMDPVIGTEPGVWLAVTSISFDISVLELYWTLSRGFKVILQEEGDRASMMKGAALGSNSSAAMGFSLFYFALPATEGPGAKNYELLLKGSKFADEHGFAAVWTPERHFHAFGGLYPSSAVTSAALATITKNVQLRAGSCVLPLHSPIRVAEEWSLIDNLSDGRVALSFASGWHVNDFAILPGNYENRRDVMFESIEMVKRLWRGEAVTFKNGNGEDCDLRTLPRPVQENPPIYISSAGNVETFRDAGRRGYYILTNMLGQDIRDLSTKLEAYREARREGGFEGPGEVAVMLHTYVAATTEESRRVAKAPFCNFMETSFDLVKVAPWMFPAFKKPSEGLGEDLSAFSEDAFSPEDLVALLDFAFDRYFETAGIFGSPEDALRMVDQLKAIGVTEVACLVDFGVETQQVLDSLEHLDRLRVLSNTHVPAAEAADNGTDYSVAAQLKRHGVTHMQCTPSMARILLADGALEGLAGLKKFLLGGEALPTDLANTLAPAIAGDLINMYGPTETTVWSTCSEVRVDEPVRIGRPIANTQIRILDGAQRLLPPGASGELCIGGEGVVRGYFGRPDLTADRFVDDPYAPGKRLYRTGDLARYLPSGELEFLGRLDQQVKVNGYRIELGEIETILSRHPAVHENVVVTREDGGPAQLVAYVVSGAASAGDTANQEKSRVDSWGGKWDAAYATGHSAQDARFDISGWLSSYDGEPLPSGEMREWLDYTLQRALESKPKRVLEIGCGTGMILYGMLGEVEQYTAIDLSSNALDNIRAELTGDELAKVRLLRCAAHELDGFVGENFDLVVINSVCQYFPSQEYLSSVLGRALELLEPGGRLFVGDVRNLNSAESFHTIVELHRAPGQIPIADLKERIAKRVERESELLLRPEYFQGFADQEECVGDCIIRTKRGTGDNEMSQFRYDVCLTKGQPSAVVPGPDKAACLERPKHLTDITAMLETGPETLYVLGVQDQRLMPVLQVRERIERGDEGSLEALRAQLGEQVSGGIHMEDLHGLDGDYEVELRPAREWGFFDALFQRKGSAPAASWSMIGATSGDPAAPHANTPYLESNPSGLGDELRGHIREYLPEYMVPTAVVVMEAFPLTANGKIDRKALPAPQVESAEPTEFSIPVGDLEETLADIWKGLLNLERVGRQENIFDLGAHSLLVVEANGQLSEKLGKRLPLVNMFRFSTIASLAEHLGGEGLAGSNVGARVSKPRAASRSRAQTREERAKAAAERRRAAIKGNSKGDGGA